MRMYEVLTRSRPNVAGWRRSNLASRPTYCQTYGGGGVLAHIWVTPGISLHTQRAMKTCSATFVARHSLHEFLGRFPVVKARLDSVGLTDYVRIIHPSTMVGANQYCLRERLHYCHWLSLTTWCLIRWCGIAAEITRKWPVVLGPSSHRTWNYAHPLRPQVCVKIHLQATAHTSSVAASRFIAQGFRLLLSYIKYNFCYVMNHLWSNWYCYIISCFFELVHITLWQVD